jgi:hypothetical protein
MLKSTLLTRCAPASVVAVAYVHFVTNATGNGYSFEWKLFRSTGAFVGARVNSGQSQLDSDPSD